MELDSNIVLTAIVTVWMAVIGAFVASAAQCAAERMAAKQSWVSGRSRCNACEHTLGVFDLIPIFSYVFSGGKCRYCGQQIPRSCLVTELAGIVLFGVIGWHFGLTLELGMWAIFGVILLVISCIDVQMRIIPNVLLVVAVINRAIWMFVLQQPLYETLVAMGISLVVPIGLLLLVLLFEKLRGVDAMGGGDIKLLLVMALYLNVIELVVALLIACVLGIICARAQFGKTIPFGPALACGCVLAATVLQPVAVWYGGLF